MKREATRRSTLVTFSAWSAWTAWIGAIGAVALWAQAVVLGAQLPERSAAALDRASVAALLAADPGTYVVTDGKLERAEIPSLPLLVQADARRGTGRRVLVPLAISGQIPQEDRKSTRLNSSHRL